MVRGRFITLEGGEGSGKSTQSKLLTQWLAGKGLPVLATREPGGSPGAERLRSLLLDTGGAGFSPLTEVLLHYAARRDHLEATIWPALTAGRWVVCDRFTDSTLAYQGHGQGADLEVIARVRRAVLDDFRPDLTLLLDLPVEEGLRRASHRSAVSDRYQALDPAFHRRVHAGFRAIAAAEPDRCVVIDALPPAGEVAARIRAVVGERFSLSEAGDAGE